MDIEEELALLKNNIALKHGVLIGDNDPIMMYVTIHQRLLHAMEAAQKAILGQYKADILLSNQQQQTKFEQQAEQVLNAALAASNKLITQTIDKHIHTVIQLLFKDQEKVSPVLPTKDKKFMSGLIIGLIGGFVINTTILLFF